MSSSTSSNTPNTSSNMTKPTIKLPVTHNLLVTQSFLDIIAENPTSPSSNAVHQVDEVSAWLNAEGSAYLGHPKNEGGWKDITTEKVAAWIEQQGMGF
ncbi:MAG: hypothetical protein M1839_003176 [Geoglossum umbratile]|nr:MAG: hypothetical protein M1839_003176 [Geoglossum umbratile]